MRLVNFRLLFVALLALRATCAAASAAILTDPFTDGNRTGGADNSGIAWYDRSANSNLSIVNDATLGTGNALSWNPNDNTVTNRGFTGVFTGGQALLTNVGDSITLNFDFRFTGTTLNTASGLTFGFYNSNGSAITADDAAAQDNDFGYRVEFGTGTTSGIYLGREQNSGAGGTGSGTGDTSTITLGTSTPVMINDTAKHTAEFSLTRTATGINLVARYDNTIVATGTVTPTSPSPSTALFSTIDEIVFSQASGTQYRIDNVVVNASNFAIPEPSTWALALGIVGLLVWQRRRA
jgi:hypothetical protein